MSEIIMFPGQHKKNDGYKAHEGKIQLELLPVEALEFVAMVATQGAKRVAARNWEQGMKWSYPFGALLRHLFAYWRGEDIDPKHGLPHLAHAGFWVLALLDFFIKGRGEDDRPKMSNKHYNQFVRYFLEKMNNEEGK